MKRVALVLAALVLASCGSAPRERIVIKEVKIPVPVPCLDEKDLPPEPTYEGDAVDLERANIFELVQAILVEREQRKEVDAKRRAVLSVCVKRPDS